MGCFIGFRGYNFLAQEMEGFLKAMQSTFCPVGFLSYIRLCKVRPPHSGEHSNEHFSVKKVE
jgi:hypothetical protein